MEKSFYKEKSAREFNLSDKYKLCVDELRDQQKKRDTIIALFATICGVLMSALEFFDTKSQNNDLMVLLFTIVAIGLFVCFIVVRYKQYKDVYWLSCDVLAQLCNINTQDVSVKLIKEIMLINILSQGNSFALSSNKVTIKTIIKILISAEFFFYFIAVIMECCVLLVALNLTSLPVWINITILALMPIGLIAMYVKVALKVLLPVTVSSDKDMAPYVNGESTIMYSTKSLDSLYRTAWFLHFCME